MKHWDSAGRGALGGVVLALLTAVPFAQENDEEPAVERGLKVNAPGAYQGYTLFSPILSGNAYLVDMEGNVVHQWETDLGPAGSVYLLDNGHLMRGARVKDNPRFDGGGIGGRIQILDWDGNLVWDYLLADDYQTAHHDTEPLPNGNVLVITWEHRFQEDAVEWGRDPGMVGEKGMWPDAVLEIKPEGADGGEIVWEWHAWDHIVQDQDSDKPNYGAIHEHPELIDINADHRDQPPLSDAEQERLAELEKEMRALGYAGDAEEEDAGDGGPPAQRNTAPDWLHTNGIDYHPELELIVLSVPNLNELWVIDHSTSSEEAAWNEGGRWGKGGDLLWRWGNPRIYGAGSDDDRRLYYQHDPTWILDGPTGELRLLVYNNGGGRPAGDFSSVEELVLPFDPEKGFAREAGAAFGPSRPAWYYAKKGEFYSGFISGAHRLPNGNTLICSGAPGRIFEVTPEKEIVWEYLNPYGGEIQEEGGGSAPPTALFRATRLAPDHPGLAARL